MIFKLYFIAASAALFTLVRSTPINRDAQLCMELCSDCKGTATFADDKCECEIEENGKEGAECLRRTRREIGDSGFNLISCDLVDDERKTRCTLGSKHYRTRTGIDQVAKYFMKDGPITGSIFKAPPYSVRSKTNDCAEESHVVGQPLQKSHLVGQPLQKSHLVGHALQKSHLVGQPLEKLHHRPSILKAPLYSAPPQQVIINIPQGYGSPITGSGTPEVITGSTHLTFQPKATPCNSAEEVGSSQMIIQPKVMPDQVVQAPHIITQPTELIPDELEPVEPQFNTVQDIEPAIAVEKPKIKSKIELQRPQFVQSLQRPQFVSAGQDLSGVKVVEIPKTITPLFMQSLLQHLSQPMLGIPQALQTITKAPGISQIVSAPGNLLNSLVSRLSNTDPENPPKEVTDDGKDDLKFSTNSDLFSHYDPDLFKHMLKSGDAVVGSANPYSMGVPSTHVLLRPTYTAMPVIQSPMMSDYSSYDREYVPHMPTYLVGSSLAMPYFDSDESYIPIYYDVPTDELNDPKVGLAKMAEKKTSTPMKEIFMEVPIAKSKKICKKSSKDENLKKIIRDTKAVSEREDLMDTHEKNQDNVGTAQATELLKVEITTTQEPIIEKTPGEERKHILTKLKTEKAKTETSSKIKKLKGEKKSEMNKK